MRSTATCIRAGFAYPLALMVVVVVAGIAMAMGNGTSVQLRTSHVAAAHSQARHAAMGALRAMVADLSISTASGAPVLRVLTEPGMSIGGCTVLLIGRDATGRNQRFGLIPAAGRVDVNAAPHAQLWALLDELNVPTGDTQGIASALVDWRDSDDKPFDSAGAERSDSAYTSATVPYAPRNASFESLDEVRLVRGVTDALFFGEDRNHNGRLDPGEDSNGDGLLTLGLRDACTLESREPAFAPDGSPRTLVRDNDQPVGVQLESVRRRLRQLFSADRAKTMIDTMHRAHDARPLANRLDLIVCLELSDAEAATLWPFMIDGNGRIGMVDAESAPQAVLASMVGTAYATTIINARPETPGQGPNWLAKALGRDGCQAAGGKLTVGSYQFLADILAMRNDGRGWARIEAVIDCSISGTPRVSALYDTTQLGWPLPWITPSMIRQRIADAGAPLDPTAVLTALTTLP